MAQHVCQATTDGPCSEVHAERDRGRGGFHLHCHPPVESLVLFMRSSSEETDPQLQKINHHRGTLFLLVGQEEFFEA